MAVDHLIFNQKKWWQANEAPLIGKHAEVKKSTRNVYVFESDPSDSGLYAYAYGSSNVKITSGTILGEFTSAKFYGADTPTDIHMVCIDPGGKFWYKVEDVTISGGVTALYRLCSKLCTTFRRVVLA